MGQFPAANTAGEYYFAWNSPLGFYHPIYWDRFKPTSILHIYIVNIITILIMIYIYILPFTNIGMTFGALDSAQNSLDFHGSVMVRTLFGSRSQH